MAGELFKIEQIGPINSINLKIDFSDYRIYKDIAQHKFCPFNKSCIITISYDD